MYQLNVISGPTLYALLNLEQGAPLTTRRIPPTGKHNFKAIPKDVWEARNWTDRVYGANTGILNEVATIYEALGFQNKSLEICKIDTGEATKKAIGILEESGFDQKVINIAFGQAEGFLTIPQHVAMYGTLAKRMGSIAAQQIFPKADI